MDPLCRRKLQHGCHCVDCSFDLTSGEAGDGQRAARPGFVTERAVPGWCVVVGVESFDSQSLCVLRFFPVGPCQRVGRIVKLLCTVEGADPAEVIKFIWAHMLARLGCALYGGVGLGDLTKRGDARASLDASHTPAVPRLHVAALRGAASLWRAGRRGRYYSSCCA